MCILKCPYWLLDITKTSYVLWVALKWMYFCVRKDLLSLNVDVDVLQLGEPVCRPEVISLPRQVILLKGPCHESLVYTVRSCF